MQDSWRVARFSPFEEHTGRETRTLISPNATWHESCSNIKYRNIPFQFLISELSAVGYYRCAMKGGRFSPHECCLQTDKCYFAAEEAGVRISSSGWTGPVGLVTDRSSTNTASVWSKMRKAAVKRWFGWRRPFAGVVGMGQRAVAVFCERWGGGDCSEWQLACHGVTPWTQRSVLFNHVILVCWGNLMMPLKAKTLKGRGRGEILISSGIIKPQCVISLSPCSQSNC